MTRISDLPQDLIEEILSRVPLTSQRAARSTCKQWNGLYKDENFTKKHRGKAANDTMMIMVCDSRVRLVSVDLHGVHKQKRGLFELSTELIGILKRIEVFEVYHCDGLLLCLTDCRMMKPDDPVVWNPYLGQVRWIKPRRKLAISGSYRYCMGYDNKNNHKILRFLDHDDGTTSEHDIFDFKSDSWRVLDLTPDWIIPDDREGLSLKGNTYFVARERLRMSEYLICFDFTSERFRHCLDLESNYRNGNTVILSAVREEQLAVLFSRVDTNTIEIWITRKIEANEVSWRNFLKVDVKPSMLRGMFSGFPPCRSFLVDEKKKVALIYDNVFTSAYKIGENNYSNIVARGKTTCWPPVVCSYVPSSVQIQKGPVHARGKRKLRDF